MKSIVIASIIALMYGCKCNCNCKDAEYELPYEEICKCVITSDGAVDTYIITVEEQA